MVPLYEIEWDGPGRLATMAHPPGGGRLAGGMATLAGAGVQVLVSALCDDEATLLELVDEPVAATRAGLEFLHFPIIDGTAPEPALTPAAHRLADRLAAELRAGRFVVTHCRAGIGRASILAGAALVRLDVAPGRAWEMIRAARGFPVPDNPAQEAWLYG